MNNSVEQIQESYRNERERVSYNVFDIGTYLNNLAEKGFVWVLKDMKDISDLEKVGVENYLNQYRANQIYDNLEKFFNNQSPKDLSTAIPLEFPQSTTSIKDKKTKKQQHLEVRDVKQFSGYKKARKLEKKIIELCKNFPSFETDHIVNQIERSAESI